MYSLKTFLYLNSLNSALSSRLNQASEKTCTCKSPTKTRLIYIKPPSTSLFCQEQQVPDKNTPPNKHASPPRSAKAQGTSPATILVKQSHSQNQINPRNKSISPYKNNKNEPNSSLLIKQPPTKSPQRKPSSPINQQRNQRP